MINYKKLTAAMAAGIIAIFTITGCSMPWQKATDNSTSNISSAAVENLAESGESTLALDFDSEDLDSSYNESECTKINLTENTAVVSGSGVTVENGNITITSVGSYIISGTLKDGTIKVNCSEKGTVRLILKDASISSSTSAPVVVEDAKKVLVTLADGTTNTITDKTRQSTSDEDYSAAFYSKADLVFNGNGTLNVNAGYRNGIKSTDDLKAVSGTFNITSAEDGIIGKDLLGIKGGRFIIKSGSDGMKSTYDKDTSKGNIVITGGTFDITAANDGIQAENILSVSGGTFNIVTGNTSSASSAKVNSAAGNGNLGGRGFGGFAQNSTTSSDSTKGLKAGNNIYITGGLYTLDCEDDGVHCNGQILISGGNLTINSGDDGIHADDVLQIDGGTIDIKKCYEGLEGAQITINDGDISIVASDDGINAADGSSSSGMEGFKGQNGAFGSGQQGEQASATNSIILTINGGNIFVNADGDGLDSNGNIVMNGGNVTVLGPTSDGDTALDYDGSFAINGGVLMAFGSSGMLETPTTAENGSCIVTVFNTVSGNSQFSLADSSGNVIMSYVPSKNYAAVIVYSADIKSGNTYTVTAGTTTQSITVNSSVTTNGVNGSMGGGFGGGQRGGMNQPGENNQQGTSVPDGSFGGGQPGANQPDRMPDVNSNGNSNGSSNGSSDGSRRNSTGSSSINQL